MVFWWPSTSRKIYYHKREKSETMSLYRRQSICRRFFKIGQQIAKAAFSVHICRPSSSAAFLGGELCVNYRIYSNIIRNGILKILNIRLHSEGLLPCCKGKQESKQLLPNL